MKKFDHKILTSTGALGCFIYDGLYNTQLGELMGCVAPDNYVAIENAIGELAVDYIKDAFNDVFGNDDFDMEYAETSHPRYYNFDTDSVIFDFCFSNEWKDWAYGYAVENRAAFVKYLADKFTSHDGYCSFTPNNWDDWSAGWNDDDWRCVTALVLFVIKQEISDSAMDTYRYGFNDDASTIIYEHGISFEYAAKYDNGMTAVVISSYDDDNYFDGYLIDADGNVVNHVRFDDEYNELNRSAYAAFRDTSLENDLTKDYTLCDVHSEQCNVPDFEKSIE